MPFLLPHEMKSVGLDVFTSSFLPLVFLVVSYLVFLCVNGPQNFDSFFCFHWYLSLLVLNPHLPFATTNTPLIVMLFFNKWLGPFFDPDFCYSVMLLLCPFPAFMPIVRCYCYCSHELF